MVDPIEWISKVGLPTTVVVSFGYALYWTCRWLAAEIIKPLTHRHITFLDSLEARDKAQTEILAAIQVELVRVREMATGHFDACDLLKRARQQS